MLEGKISSEALLVLNSLEVLTTVFNNSLLICSLVNPPLVALKAGSAFSNHIFHRFFINIISFK